MSTEWDVREAVQARLTATGAFADGGVHLTGLPETYGYGSSEFTAASIEPTTTNVKLGWDGQLAGGIDYMSSLTVTLLARHPDLELCDKLADLLLRMLKGAVNGQVLVPGYTVPGKTLVTAWTWEPRIPPERRIRATMSYEYLEAWGGGDSSQ